MSIFPTVLAFFFVSAWAWAANADCVSRLVCDDSGACHQVQRCDDALDGAQHAAAAMTPIPAQAEAEARMSTSVAVEGSGTNCKQVDICGTWKTVCN